MAETINDTPAEGCVFMYRKNEETGAVDRAEVNVESGSVEIMAGWGWSTDNPDAPEAAPKAKK